MFPDVFVHVQKFKSKIVLSFSEEEQESTLDSQNLNITTSDEEMEQEISSQLLNADYVPSTSFEDQFEGHFKPIHKDTSTTNLQLIVFDNYMW